MIEPTSGRILIDGKRHRAAKHAPSCAAASATSSSTPGCSRTARSLDNVATVPLLLGTDQTQARSRAQELLERVGLPTGVRQALPGPALRRPAAARRRGPRARRRPAGPADGRAVQRGRPGRARASCRTSSCGCRPSSARPSSSSPTTSTRRSSSATRSPSCASAARWPSSPRRPSCSPARATTSSPDFVGRDRGYRALASRTAGAAAGRTRSRRSRLGASAGRRAAESAGDGWVLVVDDQRPPAGLVRRARPAGAARRRHATGSTAAARWPRQAGRCGPRSTPPCRRPSGRGVVADEDGRLLGTITAARGARPDRGRPAAHRAGDPAAGPTRMSGLLHVVRGQLRHDRRLVLGPRLARRASRC